MTPINSTPTPRANPWHYLERQSASRTHIDYLSARQSENKAITINTKEGDTVTLTFARESQMEYLGYNHLDYQKTLARGDQGAMGHWQANRLSGELSNFDDTKEFSISIEGDLSAEEMEDITQAIGAIDGMMRGLLYGDRHASGVSGLAELDLDTLSGLKAEYGYSREIQAQSLTIEESSYARRGIAAYGGGHWGHPARRLHQFMGSVADGLNARGIEPRKLKQPVSQLFQGYQDRLDKADARHVHHREALGIIRDILFEYLEDRFEGAPGNQTPDGQ